MVHVVELNMAQAGDEEIIERAKAEDMTILTEDLDMGLYWQKVEVDPIIRTG